MKMGHEWVQEKDQRGRPSCCLERRAGSSGKRRTHLSILIVQLQRDSCVQRGLHSWTEDMLPQFITNNPFIAKMYARIVFGLFAIASI
jgi:hypothetical protein